MINFDGYMVDGKQVSFPRMKEIEYYKKGGKIKSARKRRTATTRQKQKQSTNIKINIGGGSGRAAEAPPRVITQYMGGAQPVNLSELITKMNAIESKVSNQQPLSFMNDVLQQQFMDTLRNRLQNSQNRQDEKANEDQQVDQDEADEKQAAAPASSSSSSSDDEFINANVGGKETRLYFSGHSVKVGKKPPEEFHIYFSGPRSGPIVYSSLDNQYKKMTNLSLDKRNAIEQYVAEKGLKYPSPKR